MQRLHSARRGIIQCPNGLNDLKMDGRATNLWQHGQYLTGAFDSQGRSSIYALGSYFVKVELFDEGDAIAAVVPFTTGDRYERMVRHLPPLNIL